MVTLRERDKFKKFACDLCGSNDAVEVPHARKYTGNQPIHICKKCGFVYVRKRRTAEDISKDWINDVYDSNIPAVKARQLYLSEIINNELGLKDKTVFDIGAWDGQFLKMIKGYEAKVFGIEPCPEKCVELANSGIDHFCGTIEDYNKTNKADIVTMIYTLESCSSCRDMLNKCHSILKDGGYVAIETGSRLLVPFKKPLHYYLTEYALDGVSFRFSVKTLKGMLAVCNFETVYVNRYIDSDLLCMIGKKMPKSTKIEWEGDDYREVCDFFKRWHIETGFYEKKEYKP